MSVLTDRAPAPPGSGELEIALYLLKDYLEKEKTLAAKGITLEEVFRLMGDVGQRVSNVRDAVDTVVKEQISQGLRIERHGRKLREMRAVVNTMNGHGVDDPEDTGSFRIEDTKRAIELADLQKKWEMSELEKREKAKEERENSTWWTRQRSLWLVLSMMAVFSAILSGCVSFGVLWLSRKG